MSSCSRASLSWPAPRRATMARKRANPSIADDTAAASLGLGGVFTTRWYRSAAVAESPRSKAVLAAVRASTRLAVTGTAALVGWAGEGETASAGARVGPALGLGIRLGLGALMAAVAAGLGAAAACAGAAVG